MFKNKGDFIYFIDHEVNSNNKMKLRRIIDENLENNYKRKIIIVFLNNDRKIIENLKIRLNNIIKEDVMEIFLIEEKFQNKKSDLINFLDYLK